MNELDILKDVSTKLEKSGINYMLSGSLAMSYYAQPRLTRDIDIVLELSSIFTNKFCGLFRDEYMVTEEMVNEAITHQSMFNIIHNQAIIKVDFIIRKNSKYRKTEFERRRKIKIGDFSTYIVSIEDLVISKLDWLKESGSELQKRDVKNLLNCKYDREYVKLWTEELGLDKTLREIIND